MPVNLLADLDAAAVAQGFASRADVIRIACSRFLGQKAVSVTLDSAETSATGMRPQVTN